MKILRDEIIYKGEHLNFVRRYYIDRNGDESYWEMVSRPQTFGNVALIAAVTIDNNLVLTRSFRMPLKDYVIELPAGLSDVEGEPDTETANRELLEETGYQVDRFTAVLTGPFNSGVHDDEITLFVGTGAKKIQELKLDPSEDIEVVLVPVDRLLDFIKQSDTKVDIKIPAVLPYLKEQGVIE